MYCLCLSDLLGVPLTNRKPPMNQRLFGACIRDIRPTTRFLKLIGFPLLLIGAAVFWGCSGSLATYHGVPSSQMVNGMAYYLPVGKITVKGEFKPEPAEDSSATGTGKTDSTNNLAAASPSPTPAAKEPNDTGGKPVPGTKTISIAGLTLTLSSDVEADMNAGRYVVHVPNAMFEDEIKLTVSPKHLLSAGKATTEDKTAEIVGTMAALTKAAVTGPFSIARVKRPPVPANKQPFYITFYPSSGAACDNVREQLKTRNIDFNVIPEGTVVTSDVPTKGKPADSKQGIVFRFARLYKIHIKYPIDIKSVDPRYTAKEYENITLLDTYEKFVLPDTSHEYVFEYPRLALVKAVNEVGFTDGMLTDLHTTRPSLIVGILSVPKAVAQAIIPGFPAPTSSGSASGAGGSAKN